MSEPEWTTPETLAVQRDHWKARAEAAEAELQCPIGITNRSLCSAGCCPACMSDRLAAHMEREEKAEARIAELEAQLARVPDREALYKAAINAWEEAVDNHRDEPIKHAVNAVIAAMQETKP